MLAVAFDTLKLARRLESAGMAPKQAQDTSAALSETYTEWLALGNVATREDVQTVKQELHEVKGELRAEVLATKAEILKWMFGQTLAIIGTLSAIIFAVGKSGLSTH
jgi:hypothetical protein